MGVRMSLLLVFPFLLRAWVVFRSVVNTVVFVGFCQEPRRLQIQSGIPKADYPDRDDDVDDDDDDDDDGDDDDDDDDGDHDIDAADYDYVGKSDDNNEDVVVCSCRG